MTRASAASPEGRAPIRVGFVDLDFFVAVFVLLALAFGTQVTAWAAHPSSAGNASDSALLLVPPFFG